MNEICSHQLTTPYPILYQNPSQNDQPSSQNEDQNETEKEEEEESGDVVFLSISPSHHVISSLCSSHLKIKQMMIKIDII